MNLRLPSLMTALVLAIAFPATSYGVLIAHWTGDTTAVDATGNGHDGVVNGATYLPGVAGEAFSFDGSGDSVIVPADTDLEPATLSVAFWVQAALENHIRVLVDSTHGAGQAGWAVQLNTANNLSFAYGNGATFPEVVSQIPIADGEFHHVAATLDGTTMRLYIDGAPTSTLGYTGVPAPSGRDIQLGSSLALSNRALQGALDDVRIYNHVLTPTEVIALASIPEPSTGVLLSLAMAALISRRKTAAF